METNDKLRTATEVNNAFAILLAQKKENMYNALLKILEDSKDANGRRADRIRVLLSFTMRCPLFTDMSVVKVPLPSEGCDETPTYFLATNFLPNPVFHEVFGDASTRLSTNDSVMVCPTFIESEYFSEFFLVSDVKEI